MESRAIVTSPSRLDEVRRVLDATPPRASALTSLREAPPAPAPVSPPAPAAPPATAAVRVLPLGALADVARPVGWAAGLLAVAGIIHLVLLPGHLEQSRGIGLYFCAVGAAQVVWALLFALRPTRLLAWTGLVALAVQPLAVYVLTRMVRQPFGDHAEDVDLIGIVTGVLEVAVIAPFGLYLARTRAPDQTAGRGVALPLAIGIVAGLVFGGALYGAGLVAEELVPWLDEPEEPHTHEHVASVTAAGPGAAEGLAPAGHGPAHG